MYTKIENCKQKSCFLNFVYIISIYINFSIIMLSTPLTKSILRTTDNYIKALQKAGISTIWDLLREFPRDYDDRTSVLDSFSLINIKESNTILVKLLSITSQKTANNKILTKAVLEDKNGFLAEAVWFNRKFFTTQLQPYVGRKIIVTGKVKYAFWKVSFTSPDTQTDLSKLSWEIVPVYSDLNYIPSKWTAPKIDLLKKYIWDITENLPENILEKYDFISRKEAFYKIHFPKNKNDIEQAKYRLAYEELYEINYTAISKKYEKFEATTGKSVKIPMNPELVKQILEKLPFTLTDHQKIVLFQTLRDMEKSHGMQRLLEGDVGTWKTAVAQVAAIHAILESEKLALTPNPSLLEDGNNDLVKNQTSPQPSPLEEREQNSIRKCELKSPGYVFELAREMRKNETQAEKKMWELLKNNNFEWLKFRRQHPIGRYIADFYCEELHLIIELDGKIHEEKFQKEYDEERNILLKSYWFEIIRWKNEEILDFNEDEIFKKLKSSLLLQRRGARGEVNNEEKIGIANNSRIQVVIMAPTEILARQHFEWMQELFWDFWISSHLLVWSVTKKNKEAIKADMKIWNVDVIIGTHALVQEDVLFKNLWFVVIDEQHRFWVKQREVLESWLGNSTGIIPHSLNMTATPIPRTLALTLYWDQDLSIISEYPKGRKDIYTKVAGTENQRQEIELFLRSELEKWRQAFWISPLVEESEKMDLANAISTYETLTEIFAPFTVGLLHGKMKAKEKDQIMKDFADNKIQILSSTSVVEVWVNVPNSTIMCIEWAERFGLSQLHQFRGRVGRWKHQSYCYLFPSKWNSTDRLKAMERTNNGFELAEIDLEIRWPGEVYGLRQSWVPDLKVADLRDLELISQIREDIQEMFEDKKEEMQA